MFCFSIGNILCLKFDVFNERIKYFHFYKIKRSYIGISLGYSVSNSAFYDRSRHIGFKFTDISSKLYKCNLLGNTTYSERTDCAHNIKRNTWLIWFTCPQVLPPCSVVWTSVQRLCWLYVEIEIFFSYWSFIPKRLGGWWLP